jgi:DNA-binding transcriptional LysR family regulator
MLHMDHMHDAQLQSLDLNLVVALDALLEERSVTRAAGRVGISQSAMSHALARLRTMTGDALFVRANGTMMATPRAEALGPPVRRALEELTAALRAPAAFDPRTATRTIRVATSDYAEIVLLPRLVRCLEEQAPGIDLRIVSYGECAPALLSSAAVDLVVAPVGRSDEVPGIRAKRLFDEKFVCVVRREHPLTRGELTIERYAAAAHALISPRGKEGSFVDECLAKLGLTRRVVVTVPHFLVAPHIVARSDLVLTLAVRVATMLADPLGLAVLKPPVELRLEGFRMSALWHERTQDDPAHRWIRERFVDVARTS